MSMYGMLTPIKLGVRFDPPAIILVYRERGKLRKRQIPTKNIDILTDVTEYAEKFKKDSKYKKFFERVSARKLEKIVFILQDNMKGYNLAESVERAKKFDPEPESESAKPDESEISESVDVPPKEKKNAIDDYDDDDFHDTDDEQNDKHNLTKSVSTLEEVKAATTKASHSHVMSDSIEIEELIGTLNLPSPQASKPATEKEYNSKLDSLSILSTGIKNVRSGIYDFEDSVDSGSDEDEKKSEEEIVEEVLETADRSDSDESF